MGKAMNCWIILLLLLCCNCGCGNGRGDDRDDCGCEHNGRPGRGRRGDFGPGPQNEPPCGMPPLRTDFAYNYEEKCDCND